MRLRLVVSVVVPVLTILSLCLPATHGSAPAASTHRTSSVWLPYWNMTTAFQRVTQNSDLFDLASPFWYDAATCSTVKGRTGAGSRTVIRGLVARDSA
jgi:hypothetical protein